MTESEIGQIIYRDAKSDTYGLGFYTDMQRVHSSRNLTITSVPGRSGDIVVNNNNSRKNVNLQFNGLLMLPPRFDNLEDVEDAIVNWLDGGSYSYLKLSWAPKYVYEAVVEEAPTFTAIQGEYDKENISINFNCMPYKLDATSIHYQDLPSSIEIYNGENMTAYPDWHIVGQGDFLLTVNGLPYELNDIESEIYIDGQNQLAYANATTPLNSHVVWPNNDAPILDPGFNKITLEPKNGATLTKAEWKPKWRRIL